MTPKILIFLSFLIYFYFGPSQNEISGQERPKIKSKNLQYSQPTSSFSANNRTQKSDKKVDILAEKIINTLSLNEGDARFIHEFCDDRATKIEKIKLNNDNSQQKIADLQAVNNDFDQKIKQLVSPSQFQKYEAMRRAGN